MKNNFQKSIELIKNNIFLNVYCNLEKDEIEMLKIQKRFENHITN